MSARILVTSTVCLFLYGPTASWAQAPLAEEPINSPEVQRAPQTRASLPPDLSLKLAPWLKITPGASVQARYTVNYRRDFPTKGQETTLGFTIPRIRFWLSADITDHVSLFLRPGVNTGGAFFIDQAFGEIKLHDFTIRAGQFGIPVFGEADNISPHMSLASDFSLVESTFDPGVAQGAWLNYNPRHFRGRLAITNGLRSGYSDFGNAPQAADYAITGFLEGMFFCDDWSRLDDFTSFPGSELLLKLGAGVHYQDGGRTSGTEDLSVLYVSGDLRAEGSGWNLTAEAVWTRITFGEDIAEPRPQDSYNDLGFMLQGGAFVLSWLEPFARYDHIIGDDAPRPEAFRGPGTGTVRAVTGGLNAYIVPQGHRAKLTLDFQYLFDGINGTLVPATAIQGLLDSSDDQWLLSTQLTFSI